MKKILSIIIPSYNMEAYLAKGLDSVLSIDDPSPLDVIVVNDGGKDGTLEIARSYENRFSEIVTVIDKENGNYGSCINAGLKIAQGKYVKILDADDSFFAENFNRFVRVLGEIDVDIVFSDYIKYYSSEDTELIKYSLPCNVKMDTPDFYDNEAFASIQMPAITFKTDNLRKIGYHQTERISYTDMEWCFAPMSEVKDFYYFNEPIYRYLLSREGQTMNPNVQIRRFNHVLQSLTSILESYSKLEVNEYCKDYLIGQILRHLLYVYRFFLVDNKGIDRSALREFDNIVRTHCQEAYAKSNEFEYRPKIAYKYIAEWRTGSHEFIPKKILVLERILDTLGRVHVKLKKVTDKHS